MKIQHRSKRAQGFTLIEIMLVVVIIGILAAVIGPKLAGRAKTASIKATQQSINNVKTMLGMFEIQAGRYPTTEEGLDALMEKPGELTDEQWDGPYAQEWPRDAWGEDFVYRSPGEINADFDIISKGPDKREGTDDDISNAPKSRDS